MGRFASRLCSRHFLAGTAILAGVLACATPAGAQDYYYSRGSYVFVGGTYFRQSSDSDLSGGLIGLGWRFDTFYAAELHYAYIAGTHQGFGSGFHFGIHEHSHQVQCDFLGYLPMGHGSPFALVGDVNIGGALTQASGFGASASDTSFIGGVGGGLQYQFGADWGLRALARYELSTGSGNGSAPGVELTLIRRL